MITIEIKNKTSQEWHQSQWMEFQRETLSGPVLWHYNFRIDGVVYTENNAAFNQAFKEAITWNKLAGYKFINPQNC